LRTIFRDDEAACRRRGTAWLAPLVTAGLAAALAACSTQTRPMTTQVAPPPSEPAVSPTLPPDAAAGVDEPLPTHALMESARRHRVADLDRGTLTHERLWSVLGAIVDSADHVQRYQIGRSVQGRPLFAVQFGSGPLRVLLWSQMHGNEPTATLALVDLIRFIVEEPLDPALERIADRLSVVMVPMLNPDGAQRGRRENANGIDVNRDARRQATPEARALAATHARFGPHFAFNLHDQALRRNADGLSVALSFLAPPPDANGGVTPTLTRAKQLAAVLVAAADSLVQHRITRYTEPYNRQAFGEAMQSWGTSTVLIETGDWDDDPDKEYLRHVNFVLLLAGIHAIATGSYARADLSAYDVLPAGTTRLRP
jgi:hypothetical protein